MIHFVQGDIFQAKAQAIVNPVNTVGVMGKGLARRFKERYPENYHHYLQAHKQGLLKVGAILPFQTGVYNELPLWVVNFPTKEHWRDPSQLEWIRQGLAALRVFIARYNITSIAIPALGAGLGGLLWDDVKECLLSELTGLDVAIYIYEPLGPNELRK